MYTFRLVASRIMLILAYGNFLLQIIWLGMLGGSLLLASDNFRNYVDSQPTYDASAAQSVAMPDALSVVIVAVVVVSMILIALYFMYRAPVAAGTMTLRATNTIARKSLPTVQKLTHASRKKSPQLLRIIVLGIQVGLSLIVFALTALISRWVSAIDTEIVTIVASWTWLLASILYGLAYILAPSRR